MTLNIIYSRCTVNVQQISQGYAFRCGGKTYTRSNQESLHDFFLKYSNYDTVKLRFPNEKYYLHLTFDEPDVFTSKQALQRMLSQESNGTWIEEKNNKQRYFIDKGWVFSKIEEVSKEDYYSQTLPSSLAQQITSYVTKVAIGAMALGSRLDRITNYVSSAGFISGALTSASGVFAQVPVGGEFRVNPNTTNNQQYPKITRLEDGNLVNVWYSSKTVNADVYGQLLNPIGLAIDSEFQCNTNVTGDQYLSSVAGLLGGGFVTVWAGDQTGNTDVYAKIFNATSSPIGVEFRCNTNVTDDQDFPAVARLLGGGFVTVWVGKQTGNADVYAQIFNETGGSIGAEFRCNTNTTGSQDLPAVAALLGGGFVIVWRSDHTGNTDIYGQVYDMTGGPIGSEFRVNSDFTAFQALPAVTGLLRGGFVTVWQGSQSGNRDIYGRIYNLTNMPIGPEFRCNTNLTDNQEFPAVISLLGGEFVTVWRGNQTGSFDIYAQVFNETGGSIGSEFRCNTNMTGDQDLPGVAGLIGGGFTIVWRGDQTGNYYIYGQRYNVSGNSMTTVTSISNTPSISSLNQTIASSTYTSQLSSFNVPASTFTPTTVLISSDSSSQISSTLTSSTIFSYEIPYSIIINGVDVGTFTFQGGSGIIDGTMATIVSLNLNIDLIQEGDVITLFTFSASQGNFDSLEIEGESCQSFRSQIVQNGASKDFQVVFEGTTCAGAAKPIADFFPGRMLRV